MAIDSTVRRTRRAVLGAALGGAAAAAAHGLIAASPALADTGDGALLGVDNQSDAPTAFENTTDLDPSLKGQHAAAGMGVLGWSAQGAGVYGSAGPDAVSSSNVTESGVYGYANVSGASTGVWGDSFAGTGVFGSGAFGLYGWGYYGVVGDADVTGVGVYGWVGGAVAPAPPGGVAVYARAETTSQTALQVAGKVKFDRAGKTYLSASQRSRTISKSGVTSNSYVVATLQTSVSGVYVRAVVPSSGKFTIYLSKAAGKRVYVGYLVIN